MNGFTHLIYGFIVAHIIFIIFVRKSEAVKNHNLPMLWILGMIGAWSPDMDSLGGFFENLFTGKGSLSEGFMRYHRDFSHSLIFLSVTVACFLITFYYAKKSYKRLSSEEIRSNHPFGEVPLEINKLSIITFIIMIIAFSFYNNTTKYVATFLILASMVLFAWSLIKIKKPYYGVVFFLAALSHHICDPINCEWNPFGPWRPDIEVGLFLYCGENWTELSWVILFSVFEITPYIVVLILLITSIRQFKRYNSLKSQERINSKTSLDKN